GGGGFGGRQRLRGDRAAPEGNERRAERAHRRPAEGNGRCHGENTWRDRASDACREQASINLIGAFLSGFSFLQDLVFSDFLSKKAFGLLTGHKRFQPQKFV
ncbi:hypothetical protein L6Q82_03955, partial [Burkholderia cenocepacia]|uniref:hypothetical protein n=1 Tax=Burkholderia cenocepacia TaxID=95486 RepID=UPI001F2C0880